MKALFSFLVLLLLYAITVDSLKCQTKDSSNDEKFHQIHQTCIKRIQTSESDEDDEEDSSNDYNNDESHKNNKTQNRDQHKIHRIKRQNYDQQLAQWTTTDQSHNNNNLTTDHSCMFHCIFQAMKMINRRELPDKNKMTNILLKNITDRDLQTFITDSIQECFHVVEMNQIKDKCEFSRNLGTCLAERGQANCDDWNTPPTLI